MRLVAADGTTITPAMRRAAGGIALGLPRGTAGIYFVGVTDGNGRVRNLRPLVAVR
jgi:hypothetical protein